MRPVAQDLVEGETDLISFRDLLRWLHEGRRWVTLADGSVVKLDPKILEPVAEAAGDLQFGSLAFELTEDPGWRDKFEDITVYKLGSITGYNKFKAKKTEYKQLYSWDNEKY